MVHELGWLTTGLAAKYIAPRRSCVLDIQCQAGVVDIFPHGYLEKFKFLTRNQFRYHRLMEISFHNHTFLNNFNDTSFFEG